MNIYEFEDKQFTPDRVHAYKPNKQTCIVIDNGSHTCRAGWSRDSKPKLIFRNLIAKHRGKKEETSASHYYGNNIKQLEDPRWNIRTQYDMDVVSHFDVQEHAFDYLFKYLGINTNNSVNHPVCITEGVCIPNQSRQNMSELLFECYNVPHIVYGVDKLFSWRKNMKAAKYGIIVSCGYQTSHVLPIVNGMLDAKNARRLNAGGMNMMIHLQQLLQLKHPNHSSLFNLSRAQELLKTKTYFPQHFFEELKKWKEKDFRESKQIKIKVPVINTVTEKDIEFRRVQAKRLKEVNQKKREEKTKQDEEKLSTLEEMLELETYNSTTFKQKLKQQGFKDVNEVETTIDEIKEKIKDRKLKSELYFEEMRNWDSNIFINNHNMSYEEVQSTIVKLEDEKVLLQDKQRKRGSHKQALNKRKSYASKERMRILNQLAKSGNPTNVNKTKTEDTFGMKDSDWEVYKYINKQGSDSEDEQEQERLNEIEQSLTQSQLLINRLMVGRGQMYEYLPLTTEQIHIPEILYQPSIIGNTQEGLTGMFEYMLKNYDEDIQKKLIENIFITGGVSKINGFKERLSTEIMAVLPFLSKYNIYQAKDCLLDSWYGAKEFIENTADISKIAISKEDYDEYGVGLLQEHQCSNVYVEFSQ